MADEKKDSSKKEDEKKPEVTYWVNCSGVDQTLQGRDGETRIIPNGWAILESLLHSSRVVETVPYFMKSADPSKIKNRIEV